MRKPLILLGALLILASCVDNKKPNNTYTFYTAGGYDFRGITPQIVTPEAPTNLRYSFVGENIVNITCTNGYELLGGNVPDRYTQNDYVCNNEDGCGNVQAVSFVWDSSSFPVRTDILETNINSDSSSYLEPVAVMNEIIGPVWLSVTNAYCIPAGTQSNWQAI